jgi:hypothetical protein
MIRETNIKGSQKDMYEAIKIFLSGEDVEIKTSCYDDEKDTCFERTRLLEAEDIITFCDERIEALNKRNSKPNKKQLENEDIKIKILSILENAEKGMTITEITKAMNNEYSFNKISSLVTQLKRDEKVLRTEEKKVAYFEV